MTACDLKNIERLEEEENLSLDIIRTEAFATHHFTANWIQMASVLANIFLHAAGTVVDWCPYIIHATIIQNLAITQQRFVLSLIRLLSHRT